MESDDPSPALGNNTATQSSPPIERLPEEILNVIFLLCLPYPRYRAKLSPLEAPTLLTHICRRWRESAHGFVALWSSLEVELLLRSDEEHDSQRPVSKPGEQKFGALSDMLNKWSARNKENPFTLHFAIDDMVSKRIRTLQSQLVGRSFPGSTWEQVMEELEQLKVYRRPRAPGYLVHRLLVPVQRSLTNLTLRHVPLMDLQPLAQGSFPALERLGLLLIVGDELKDVDINPTIPPLRAFMDSPRLRSVAAKHLPPGDHIKLPWAQLTHFVEFKCRPDPTWHFLYTHIHSVTSLHHLYISLDEFHARHSCNIPGWQAGRSSLPFEPVVLPKLRKLSIYRPKSSSRTLQPELWPRFDFPNLEALQIVGYSLYMGDSGRWESSDIDTFTRKFRGWTQLTHLSLHDVGPIPVVTLRIILSAMPNLTMLDFEARYEHLAELAFSLDPATVHLIPNLRHLILQFDDNNIDGGQWYWGVLEFVESRLVPRLDQSTPIGDQGLQKVTIYASDPTSKYVLDAVEGMSQQNMFGIRIEVEVHQKKTDLYNGWQSWSDMDEDLTGWPGLEDIAVRDGF